MGICAPQSDDSVRRAPATLARPGPARFGKSPLVAFYEVTQACDLVCAHCRACAQPRRNPAELSPALALSVLDDLARFPDPPLVVLTGGDPMKRPDIFDIVRHGSRLGLSIAMTPSATSLVTRDALAELADSGLVRLAVSIDGADATSHDGLRGVAGSFARSLEILCDARACGLTLQVNTTVHRGNLGELARMAGMLEPYDLTLWSVFFLVPVGRGLADQRIAPEQYEEAFALLSREAKRRRYLIKTTEAPHYRRFVLQQRKLRGRRDSNDDPSQTPIMSSPGMMGTNDGNGVVFIGHTGLIQPSGFLPIPCGRFPGNSIVDVYQEHQLMLSLRDADGFAGKCGVCEYRTVCGGSRARAFALTGDALGSDPDCAYVPPAWERRNAED
jgi:radical SAM protein